MYEGFTRFKGVTSADFSTFKRTAEDYPRQLTPTERIGFSQKPLDWSKGHTNYLFNMYQLLNGIQAMKLEPKSTIVEVGSGAGWATEILAGLGYKVECLEPADVMLEAARERVPAYLKAHAMPQLIENVRWHCCTLEESALPDASADAMLFFESFHHIIDEHAALRNARRILKPGAVLCILGDSNWNPGNKEQETFWQEEMDRFGTLESPFTHGYLEHVLTEYGFGEVQRHHSVNGLVPIERGQEPVRSFAQMDAETVNLIIARRL